MKDEQDRNKHFNTLFKDIKNNVIDMYKIVTQSDKNYKAFVLCFMPCVVGAMRWKYGIIRAMKEEVFDKDLKTKDDETFAMLIIEK